MGEVSRLFLMKIKQTKPNQVFLWPFGCRVPLAHATVPIGTMVKVVSVGKEYAECVIYEGKREGEKVTPSINQEVELI